MVDKKEAEYDCEYCRDQGWVYSEGQPCPECQGGPTPDLEIRILTPSEFEPIAKELEEAQQEIYKAMAIPKEYLCTSTTPKSSE
jgi:hypothetical protein